MTAVRNLSLCPKRLARQTLVSAAQLSQQLVVRVKVEANRFVLHQEPLTFFVLLVLIIKHFITHFIIAVNRDEGLVKSKPPL